MSYVLLVVPSPFPPIFPLHHPIVAPRPSATQVEFFLSAGGGIRIVKGYGIEDHAELAHELFKDRTAVGQTRKLDTIAVDVQNGRFFPGDDNFSKVAQGRRVAAEELDQAVRIFQRI